MADSRIDAFRNELYKLNLRDFSNASGLYLDVVRKFRFRSNKVSTDLDVGGIALNAVVSKVDTDIKITIDSAPLRGFSCSFQFQLAADNQEGLKRWRDFVNGEVYPSSVEYVCQGVLVHGNGYTDKNSGFKIRFQINLVSAANILKPNLFTRAFRLDASFFMKDYIDQTFADVLKTTVHELAGLKNKPNWRSFLNFCGSSKEFLQSLQMKKEDFLHLLRERLEVTIYYDIALTGCVKYLFIKRRPRDLSVLVKNNNGVLRLDGRLEEVLGKVESLAYTPVPQPVGRNELTREGIEAMEKTILMSGCLVFQSFFVSKVVKNGYEDYTRISGLLPADENEKSNEADTKRGKITKNEEETEKSEEKQTDEAEDYYYFLKKLYDLHPCNKWKSNLQPEFSLMAKYQPDKNHQWKSILNKNERSKIKSKEVAEDVGRRGEGHAAQCFEAEWLNILQEKHHAYDISVRDIGYEVKVSSIDGRESYLTAREYRWTEGKHEQFTVLYVPSQGEMFNVSRFK